MILSRKLKENKKILEERNIPYFHQMIVHHSLLFMILPKFIKNRFYNRDLLYSREIIEEFKKRDTAVLGFASSSGIIIYVK